MNFFHTLHCSLDSSMHWDYGHTPRILLTLTLPIECLVEDKDKDAEVSQNG